MATSSRAGVYFALAVLAGLFALGVAAYGLLLFGESVSSRGSGTGNVLLGALGVVCFAGAAILLVLANTLWGKSQRPFAPRGGIACPNCEATVVHRTNRAGIWEGVILYRLGYRAYRCESCDARFCSRTGRSQTASSAP